LDTLITVAAVDAGGVGELAKAASAVLLAGATAAALIVLDSCELLAATVGRAYRSAGAAVSVELEAMPAAASYAASICGVVVFAVGIA
jgi:hypothetical protein